MIRLIIDADLSSEELQVLISEVNILHRDVFKKPLVLQQTACYTALELLQQMVGERSLANAFNSDYRLKQKNYSEIDALRFVMELIKERQANAV